MNRNTLTTNAKIVSVEQSYLSPVAAIPPYTTPASSMYCFIAKEDDWANNANPDIPTQDIKSLKIISKHMIAAKKLELSDISPVAQRIDWTLGTKYAYYSDAVNLFVTDANSLLINNFYIKNKYDQVFKCLWNANTTSSIEPYFEPGTYDTSNIFSGVDGYKWKYMYTIDQAVKLKFMDSKWIPVPIGNHHPNPLISSYGFGSLDTMNIITTGSGYNAATAPITVSISGDGTGATAIASTANGGISDIIVTNPGKDYTYATVTISSLLGSGATIYTTTSPVGGHAFDPISELGCNHIMFTSKFSWSESGNIPTDISYNQLGIIINPTSISESPNLAEKPIYRCFHELNVINGYGGYLQNEIVYQGNSITNATFTGKVLSWDSINNIIKVINVVGSPTNNGSIFGNLSNTVRTLSAYTAPDFVAISGYISYIENRSPLQRSSDGVEQVRIVLGY